MSFDLLAVRLTSVNGKDIRNKPAKYSGFFVRNYRRTECLMSDIDTPTTNQNSHELGSRHAATDLTSYTQVSVSVMTFTLNGFLLKYKTGTTPMALWH